MAGCLPAAATGYSQNLSISLKEVALNTVFKEIQKQSAYYFFYNERLLQETKKVTIHVKNASVESVLDICFKDQPIGYLIDEKQIVLRFKEPVYKEDPESYIRPVQPPIDISGKIMDEQRNGLAGASIKLKGTEQGVAADVNGNFAMQVPDAGAVIVISSVGYKTLEVTVSSARALIDLFCKRKNRK